jgi:hypothetical protein
MRLPRVPPLYGNPVYVEQGGLASSSHDTTSTKLANGCNG